MISTDGLVLTSDFCGGNMIFVARDQNNIYIRQDPRDTVITWSKNLKDWFYWYFEARCAVSEEYTFHLSGSDALGPCGPAVSKDEGKTWEWLHDSHRTAGQFRYRLTAGEPLRFSSVMPSLPAHCEDFLNLYNTGKRIRHTSLCFSKKGRDVPLLRAGNGNHSQILVLITCRHHCCETPGNYVLEGFMTAMLDIYKQNQCPCRFIFVPFTDMDGVVDGDQGKCRYPHDHNRDYGIWRYPETKAINDLVDRECRSSRFIHFDLHSPMLDPTTTNPRYSDRIFTLYSRHGHIAARQKRFSGVLEAVSNKSLPYNTCNDVAWGEAHNAGGDAQGMQSRAWFNLNPSCIFSETLEIPYALAQGKEVNQTTARGFGKDLYCAVERYVNEMSYVPSSTVS